MPKATHRYDWPRIRAYYEEGHTVRECRERFGFSSGAWHHAVRQGYVVSRYPAKPRGETRRAVAELFARGMSQGAIARALGVSKPTVCFHLRMLGIPPREDFARRYDWTEIRAYYETGHSAGECQRRFGFSRNAWWDAIGRGAIAPRPRQAPLGAVLGAGKRRNRYHVKGRLLLAGLKEPRCEHCGLTAWRGQPVLLELHHTNGDGLDNRLENLLLLCPNCHSQTDTWGGRNKGRKAA